jgi:hypothetical protein
LKQVYTHENVALVGNARNLLEAAGIACRLQNQYAGGGSGELPYVQAWPELWVDNDEDYQRACELIETALRGPQGDDWQCADCSEDNAGSFEICWRCGSARRGQ